MRKNRLRSLLCAVLLLMSLWAMQRLLMPKYMATSRDGALIGEYYHSGYDHDVVFIGDCEVYENFSPITLWENYGISSYIRGSAQQTIWQSYYLLEETLRYETPKVVVFNVLAMQYDSPESTGSGAKREAYNRMTLDGMRWSRSKWQAVQASMTEEERRWHSTYTYLFPLLRFHDRWSQLTKEDFTYFLCRDPVSYNGYLMHTGVRPMTAQHAEPKPINLDFGPNSYAYLDRIRQLCSEHGVQLVLIKAPSQSPIWWPEWEAQISAYAETYRLPYVNFLPLSEEIGLDWQRDTYDTGLHLNVSGAEKLSLYFGAMLQEQFGLPDHLGEQEYDNYWTPLCTRYQREKQGG